MIDDNGKTKTRVRNYKWISQNYDNAVIDGRWSSREKIVM